MSPRVAETGMHYDDEHDLLIIWSLQFEFKTKQKNCTCVLIKNVRLMAKEVQKCLPKSLDQPMRDGMYASVSSSGD